MRDGWENVELGRLLTLRRRQVVKDLNGEYKLLTMAINGKGNRLRKMVSGDGLGTAKYEVHAGDLMVSKIDARKGAAAILPDELHGAIVTGDFLSYEVNRSLVHPAYMDMWVRRPEFAELADTVSSGTTNRVRMDVHRFPSLKMLLPPMQEQERIVDLVGAVDDAIDAAEDQVGRLESLWWELTRSIERLVASEEMRPLGDISTIHGGLAKNKKDALRADAVEAPYLRVANVHRRRLDLSEVTSIIAPRSRVEAALLQPGDLLMNEGGDRDKLGRGAIWRGEVEGCTHQNHVFRVRITDDDFVPEFVSAWANSFGQKWFDIHGSQTTGIASISKTTLSQFPVPAIPREDQARWAETLDGVSQQQWDAEEQQKRLLALRSNLLTTVLSGEHEIPESYNELMETS